VKQQAVNSFLEKKLKKKTDFSYDESVQLALEALQSSLGNDLKSHEVEVVTINKTETGIKRLTAEEIEHHLNTIAERD